MGALPISALHLWAVAKFPRYIYGRVASFRITFMGGCQVSSDWFAVVLNNIVVGGWKGSLNRHSLIRQD